MSKFRQLLLANYLEHHKKGKVTIKASSDLAYKVTIPSYEKHFGELVNNLPSGSRILDVGCGVGFLLSWLSRKTNLIIEGVDICEPEITLARKNLRESVGLHCMDAVSLLKKRRDFYNGIFATDLLEHIEHDDALLELLKSVLNSLVPGGFFAVKVPNMANFSGMQLRYKDLTHARGFTEKSIEQCLQVVGFVNCRPYATRPIGMKQRLRREIEDGLHWVVYRICGCNENRIYSRVLYCVAEKAAS
jgi:2-polyprenyl-3-methyl-5-hydroxy-6-metoxy-1,4-benzoquinol methylase